MNTLPTQNPQKILLPLQKSSILYKLTVSSLLEYKIRELAKKYPSTEYSGVLFYSVKPDTSFKDNSLHIIAEDFLIMDIGNTTSTAFEMGADVINYMTENDLLDCCIGLIHTHHTMQTWFSGVDMNTLQAEGNDTNVFLSLIVNNEGAYNAMITRKSKLEYISDIKLSYLDFGDEEKSINSEKVPSSKEVIVYNQLSVTREEPKEPEEEQVTLFKERIKEIEDKCLKPKYPIFNISSNKDFNSYIPNYDNLLNKDVSTSNVPNTSNGYFINNFKDKYNLFIKVLGNQLLLCNPLYTATYLNTYQWKYNQSVNIKKRFKDLAQYEEFIISLMDTVIYNSILDFIEANPFATKETDEEKITCILLLISDYIQGLNLDKEYTKVITEVIERSCLY